MADVHVYGMPHDDCNLACFAGTRQKRQQRPGSGSGRQMRTDRPTPYSYSYRKRSRQAGRQEPARAHAEHTWTVSKELSRRSVGRDDEVDSCLQICLIYVYWSWSCIIYQSVKVSMMTRGCDWSAWHSPSSMYLPLQNLNHERIEQRRRAIRRRRLRR